MDNVIDDVIPERKYDDTIEDRGAFNENGCYENTTNETIDMHISNHDSSSSSTQIDVFYERKESMAATTAEMEPLNLQCRPIEIEEIESTTEIESLHDIQFDENVSEIFQDSVDSNLIGKIREFNSNAEGYAISSTCSNHDSTKYTFQPSETDSIYDVTMHENSVATLYEIHTENQTQNFPDDPESRPLLTETKAIIPIQTDYDEPQDNTPTNDIDKDAIIENLERQVVNLKFELAEAQGHLDQLAFAVGKCNQERDMMKRELEQLRQQYENADKHWSGISLGSTARYASFSSSCSDESDRKSRSWFRSRTEGRGEARWMKR